MIDVGRDLERMRDYVAGRLSDLDVRAFEDRLARDPELVRELELSQRLREGLEQLRDSGRLEVAGRRGTSRRWAWGAALAATLAGVTLLLWMQAPGRGPVALASSMTSGTGPAATFTFMAMRGPWTPPMLDLPARGVVELRASRSSTSDAARYRLELDRRNAVGEPVKLGELGGLSPAADGLVHAYVDAGSLAAGDYELRVQAEADQAAGIEAFAFSLRNPAR